MVPFVAVGRAMVLHVEVRVQLQSSSYQTMVTVGRVAFVVVAGGMVVVEATVGEVGSSVVLLGRGGTSSANET